MLEPKIQITQSEYTQEKAECKEEGYNQAILDVYQHLCNVEAKSSRVYPDGFDVWRFACDDPPIKQLVAKIRGMFNRESDREAPPISVEPRFDYGLIPRECRRALEAYVKNGSPLGHFLEAIVCNDLREAVDRADEYNEGILGLYVRYMFNKTPMGCWGSRKKVDEWRNIKSKKKYLSKKHQIQ